jgi:capsular polysaccharide export protein
VDTLPSPADELEPPFASPFGRFPSPPRAVVHGRGVAAITTLPALLDDVRLVRPNDAGEPDVVLAWGRKPSAERAERWAAARQLPLIRLEDGFLRSIDLGDQEPPLSIVIDDAGIYYDASQPSRLEQLALAPRSAAALQRAAELAAQWRTARVSKYNHAREHWDALQPGDVLVIDQTFGDASIRFGQADVSSFTRMLQAALDEHPQARVLLKVHPDVAAGRKRGHFARLSPGEASRVSVLASACHPPGLLEAAGAVYTVTSQFGFEALLWGCASVRVFGMPFYAGWSLTQDELAPPSRRSPVSKDALVAAALIDYPRYLNPETGQRCTPEDLLAWFALQRRLRERFPPVVHALAFSRWKKPIVRTFFGGSELRFVRRESQLPAGAALAVWGRRELTARAPGAPTMRLEDGFLRSVGLGADLVRPMSWVMDSSGLYYDATRPSDLERLLAQTAFDPALLDRAARLREQILALGLTKYNVGAAEWQRPSGPKPVVLVVGQVESDAAVALGSGSVSTNMGLLQAARQMRPDAHLVYKPHPDVVAQLRAAGRGEGDAARHCDEIVIDAPMDRLLKAVDEVHVISSLAGFEALLRQRPVVAHGLPFYAGWGLTTDMQPHPALARRTRRLGLDELVAGVLILYPTYVSRSSGRFTTPERTLDELALWREHEGPTRATAMRRLWRTALRWGRRWSGGPA